MSAEYNSVHIAWFVPCQSSMKSFFLNLYFVCMRIEVKSTSHESPLLLDILIQKNKVEFEFENKCFGSVRYV